MEQQHPIQEVMADTLGKMRELVDSNTVIGSPITTQDGVTILPVSKITFGFVSGGSDFATEKQKDLFGGATSSGASIIPVGFLVIQGTNVRLIQLAENGRSIDRVLNMVPDVIDKVESFISKSGKKAEGNVEVSDQMPNAQTVNQTEDSNTQEN